MTQKQVRERNPEIAGATYVNHTIKPLYFFGLKAIWFSNVKVNISDPTRTVVDMILFPQFCGGLNFISDALKNYFNSGYKDIDLLMSYLKKTDLGKHPDSGVVHRRCLALTGIRRSSVSKVQVKHKIKRIDRLIRNAHPHGELFNRQLFIFSS
jgi:predicted transcriptional regulator of viral defense system